MTDEHESGDPNFAQSFRREYGRTPLPEPEALARIEAAVCNAPRPRRTILSFSTWLEPRTLTVRPLVAAAAVVALLGMGVLLARVALRPRGPQGELPWTATDSHSMYPVRFMLVAPTASRVALVGDFNGWDEAATPMRQDVARNSWTVTVSLPAGWHAYAFVVDGAQWIHDPGAPLAPPDEFGGPRSVVVVGEHGEGV